MTASRNTPSGRGFTLERTSQKKTADVKTSLYIAIMAVPAVLLPSASDSHASSAPADSVHFCLPFDPEQRQSDEPQPAGKWASDLNVGEPRTVRLFYVLPNDRPYRTEVVDSMRAGILDLQTFFAGQMEAHGHGNTTFRIETDDQGVPIRSCIRSMSWQLIQPGIEPAP